MKQPGFPYPLKNNNLFQILGSTGSCLDGGLIVKFYANRFLRIGSFSRGFTVLECAYWCLFFWKFSVAAIDC